MMREAPGQVRDVAIGKRLGAITAALAVSRLVAMGLKVLAEEIG
jgi:hypothetical protein